MSDSLETAPEAITADLAEARDILAGRSTATPQFRHLAALQASAQFWKVAAQEANELIVLLESLYDQRAAAADVFADQVCGGSIH